MPAIAAIPNIGNTIHHHSIFIEKPLEYDELEYDELEPDPPEEKYTPDPLLDPPDDVPLQHAALDDVAIEDEQHLSHPL